MPTVVGEKDLLKQVMDWLALHRVFHYRNNTGALVANGGARKRFVRFGWPGSPDIICVRSGQYVGIECKALNGEQSQAQRNFQSDLEAAGGKYILCRKLEDAIEGLR